MKAFPANPILIVDDEEQVLLGCEMMLCSAGIDNLLCCSDSRQVMGILAQQEIEVILLDLAMPHIRGQELLPDITGQYPQIPVIIVTGFNELETAIDCMRHGAFDYMVKPVEGERLVSSLRRALELCTLKRENQALRTHLLDDGLQHPEAFGDLITADPTLIAVFKYVEAIASSPECAIVTGETGVGKELAVRALHQLSGVDGQLISVNVAGLDDTMLADALFGHEPGAFTGATTHRDGLIQKAEGGTLFLDEIGDLSPVSQTKLLRLLQEHEYLPLGADEPKYSDARIVVATHRNLLELHRDGTFRPDLFYRLQTHHIHLPPLRNRVPEDILLLTGYFIDRAAAKLGKDVPSLPPQLVPMLRMYDFPGNVRELEAMIFDAVSRHLHGGLSLDSIETYLASRRVPSPTTVHDSEKSQAQSTIIFPKPLPTIREATWALIENALEQSEGNQALAARWLGVTPQALSQRLKRAGTKRI